MKINQLIARYIYKMKMKMQLADILIGIKTILLANLVQYGLVINIIRFLLRKLYVLTQSGSLL